MNFPSVRLLISFNYANPRRSQESQEKLFLFHFHMNISLNGILNLGSKEFLEFFGITGLWDSLTQNPRSWIPVSQIADPWTPEYDVFLLQRKHRDELFLISREIVRWENIDFFNNFQPNNQNFQG